MSLTAGAYKGFISNNEQTAISNIGPLTMQQMNASRQDLTVNNNFKMTTEHIDIEPQEFNLEYNHNGNF